MGKTVTAVTSLVLAIILFAAAGYWLYRPQWVYEVSVDGQVVGHVDSLEEYREIVADIHHNAEELWQCELTMDQQVAARRVLQWHPRPLPWVVRARVEALASYTASSWVIEVNGKPVVYVDAESTARALLDEVKEYYYPQSGSRSLLSVQIVDNISISRTAVDPEQIVDSEEALAVLLSGNSQVSTYTVRRGDTLSGISRSTGVPVDTLRSANNISGDTIQEGQVLHLESSTAIVHVRTVEELKVTESIPRPVQYRSNPNISVRGDQVIQSGANGERTVVYHIELVNGQEVKRTVVSNIVTKQPVPRIIMPGSGYWSQHTPTSFFRFPMNTGSIPRLGHFGDPRDGGRRAHQGLDIAAPTGTPIYAAADGVVVTRAWHHSYGYYLVLDHGNGYRTLYAHLSRYVSGIQPGTRVVRGQPIAYVGNTGNSTGSHLHWEVIRNGTAVNPLNFFRRR